MDTGTVQRYLNASVEATKTQWDTLVRLALELPTEPGEVTNKAVNEAATAMAFASRAGTESLKRKLLAIQHARSTGLAPEEIMAQGQEVTVSTYNASKRTDQLDQKVWLQWKVTGVLRELVQGEYTRICEVLKFTTAEQFFEWLYAQLHYLSPEELRHAAGEATPQKPASQTQRTQQGKGKDTGKGKQAPKSPAIDNQADAGHDRQGPEEPHG